MLALEKVFMERTLQTKAAYSAHKSYKFGFDLVEKSHCINNYEILVSLFDSPSLGLSRPYLIRIPSILLKL